MSSSIIDPLLTTHIGNLRAGAMTFTELRQRYPHLSLEDLSDYAGFQYPERVISVRHVDEGEWPFEDAARIRTARRAYDDGIIEMATGCEFKHFVLYSFPRKRIRNPVRPYFRAGLGFPND